MDETGKVPSIIDEDVQVWSDFLRMRYHPKTNVILKEYQHNNPTKWVNFFYIGLTEVIKKLLSCLYEVQLGRFYSQL